MQTLQKFIDETFQIMTGLGEMKVAEAIFLAVVDDAAQAFSKTQLHNDVLLKVISLAYEGQNIIKKCAHLPRNSDAKKPAYDLHLVANKIDSLISEIGVAESEEGSNEDSDD